MSARCNSWLIGAVAVPLALAVSAPAAHAQSAAKKQEARERFDRGYTLFNQGDDAGALAEFERAYEIVPHPLVLYNIGLVHVAMKRPVEATDTFDRLLAAPGALDAERLDHARRVRAEQSVRIAELEISVNAPGATVEIDNQPAAATGLGKPLRVASGQHIVAIAAPGHLPARRVVTVAGGTRAQVAFELVRSEARPAHVAVRTRIPDVDVLVDGQLVGTTPLAASLALAPGRHELALRRHGYLPLRQPLELGEGSTGEVRLDPQVDRTALHAEQSSLALEISEPEAVVFVDGEPRGGYSKPLVLPRGRHLIRIERANFFPFERMVTLRSGATTKVAVVLVPEPAHRAEYRQAAVSQRTWGWVSVAGGGAAVLGSGAFLLVNRNAEVDAEDHFHDVAREFETGGRCDDQNDACLVEIDLALEDLEAVRGRYKFGYVGLGVGAAALGFGAFLLLSNDDPERYEPSPESDLFGTLTPDVRFDRAGGSLGVRGRF